MPYIYEPKGRALEYAPLAINIYSGTCSHRCSYCYVAKIPYYRQAPPAPRTGLIDGIRKEAPKYAGREVHLCFTCDPFMSGLPTDTTTGAVSTLLSGGCDASILTKAGQKAALPFLRSFLAHADRIRWGATLTFDNDRDSREWEPGAAMPGDRIAALESAHNLGYRTWVSFEPVISTDQSLSLMRQCAPFVDLYKIGRWNHDPRSNDTDWKRFALTARDLCENLGKKYVLKQDLKKLIT